MSAYMTVSLTVERYISVVHPLLAIQHRSSRFCFIIAAPGLIFSFLFTLPNYFLLECKDIYENIQNPDDLDVLQLLSNHSIFGYEHTHEAPTPRFQLVWVRWRNSHAFTTVSNLTISHHFKTYLFWGKQLRIQYVFTPKFSSLCNTFHALTIFC